MLRLAFYLFGPARYLGALRMLGGMAFWFLMSRPGRAINLVIAVAIIMMLFPEM